MTQKLKTLVKDILTEKQLSMMPTSFDVVGDILIFAEFPQELKSKERKIADRILQKFQNIKVITKKTKQYSGRFRLPTIRIMGGERRKTTLHKENNIRLKVHVQDVYFSPRLSTERQRVTELVRKGENVLVLFSGCGPYTTAIAKNTACEHVTGIEINPIGHELAQENAHLNKVQGKITLRCGDANRILPRIKESFDRIIMPLPKAASEYLPAALRAAKSGAIFHFYSFAEEGAFKEEEKRVRGICKREGKSISILRTIKCGQYSPGHFRICIDFRMN